MTPEERAELLGLIKTGKRKAQHVQYAHLLLGSDESEGQLATRKSELSARYRVSERMVERVRKSFCEQGMGLFEKREGRTRSDKKIDARVEAHLIALCCGPVPEGEPRWKLQLLADELVRSWLNIAEIQVSIVAKQALDRPFKDKQGVKMAVMDWQDKQNLLHKGANWQFRTKDTRIKLKKLYPTT